MQPRFLDEAREWLIRAERNLLMAERSLQGSPILGEAAAFHAQQAAEKALKGFLAVHDRRFSRTHDLLELVTRCESINSQFSQFLNSARILTPYAVRFHYLGGPLEPEVADAQQALGLARDILDFVRQQLSLRGET